MAIRKLIVCLGLAWMVWVSIFVLARAIIPFDPKLHDVIAKEEKTISVERAQIIAQSATNQFKGYVIPILILDILVIVLSYFTIMGLPVDSINVETTQEPRK